MSIERLAKHRSVRSTAVKIALAGGRVGQSTFVSQWGPYCDNPVRLDRRITSREGVKSLRIGAVKIRDEVSAMEVSNNVPCRRCEKCLLFRQMRWRERALTEIQSAKRTWFVTLTFSPLHLAGILVEARSGEMRDIEAAAYRHVQRFIKRLRKGHPDLFDELCIVHKAVAGCEFRYLAVYERGEENGRSHYHLFLHEIGTRPILKELIERQWRSFVNARLVGSNDADGAASYLTKYATKSFEIRPRASGGYGKKSSPQISSEI